MSRWNDDEHTAQTAVSLAFCYYLLYLLSGKPAPWAWRRAGEGDEPAAQRA